MMNEQSAPSDNTLNKLLYFAVLGSSVVVDNLSTNMKKLHYYFKVKQKDLR